MSDNFVDTESNFLDDTVELLPTRETLQGFGFGINISPVITVTPVVVIGNALAIQVLAYKSSVSAMLFQTVGISV